MFFFMVAGTIAALKIALDIKRKKRDERKRDIRNAERDEGRVNNSLRQKKKETKRLNRRKKQIGKRVERKNRDFKNEKRLRIKKRNTHNNYRDVINPTLREIKQDTTNDLKNLEYNFNASDVKNKLLLTSILNGESGIEEEQQNIDEKTREIHAIIQTQNNHLDKTINTVGADLESQQLTSDRASLYEDHIKQEYVIANNAFWYLYYILLIGLAYLYHRKDAINKPNTMFLLVALLLFPYWMYILEGLFDMLMNLTMYANAAVNSISKIPRETEKKFDSLF